MGGLFSIFHKNRPQQHQKRAVLHTSQANGGARAPPPPWLRYWVKGKQSKPFEVGVGLRQGRVLQPLLFIVCRNRINKCNQVDECATIGNEKAVVCYSLMIWFYFLLQNLASSAH